MPGQFLTLAERKKLDEFPEDIATEDIISYFTLAGHDLTQIPQTSSGANRIGFVLRLCSLRFLGFFPKELLEIPLIVQDYGPIRT